MLNGRYGEYEKYFGKDVAEEIYQADITRAKKKDKIKRLKEKLLEMPVEDVGMAYKHVLASDVGKKEDMKTETSWEAENIILRIQILEMEI